VTEHTVFHKNENDRFESYHQIMDYARCIYEGCGHYAVFGDDQASYCEFHKGEFQRFKGFKRRICIASGCQKRATFNLDGAMTGIFCLEHKPSSTINVNVKKCVSCKKVAARYNTREEYEKGALYCRTCRDKNPLGNEMVDCIEKLCDPPRCWKQGTFGRSPRDKILRCLEHKEDGMIDQRNWKRHCEFNGCTVQANYNLPTEKRARFCKKHKEVGMIDMYHPKCEEEGCNLRPCYNDRGSTFGRFCKTHKKDGMIDVLSKRCEKCEKVALYNYVGMPPRFCTTHQEQGMYDVRRNICEIRDCHTQCSYGYQGQTTTRCASHKKIGMMRCPTSKCIVRGCGEYAHFGLLGEIMPHFCELHTPDTSEYINLVEQKCNNCGLLNILGKDMMCMYCSPIDKSYRHEKQEYMKSWLIKKSYDILSYDKPIDGFKCGRERPDFLLQNFDGSLSIIIEVDEYQHMFSGYTDECERTRMRNIAEAIGHPTVFLRFNPDGYRPRANHKQIINLLERYDVFDKVLHKYRSIDQHDLKSLPGVVFYIHLFFDDFNVDDIGDNIYVLVPHE